MTDSPDQIKQLIIDLIKETDNYFKTKEKIKLMKESIF